jgi:hypothetical protein
MGVMLDPVMGMTIDDYCRLCEKFGKLDDLVRVYFEKGWFHVTQIDVKLASIFIDPGSLLTFRVWLTLQRAFERVDLDAEIGDWAEGLLEGGDGEGDSPGKEVAMGEF